MRKIEKPAIIPAKLIEIHSLIADDLYKKKEGFKWRDEHYNIPIKKELKDIYYNKCGYCEIQLVEHDCDEKFSIEHFRPKEYYYWLGGEWTNLFPACTKCNNNKGNDFPLQLKDRKIKQENAPFNEDGILILSKCLVDNEELLKEQPLYLHPEIDEPLHFFKINNVGKIYLQENLDKFEIERGRKMLNKLLSTERLEYHRKKLIEQTRKLLRKETTNFLKYCSENYTQSEIKLSFFSFFETLFTLGDKEHEFSLVGYYMNENFEDFFLDEYEPNVQELIKYAYSLFLEEMSKKNP